MFYSDEKHYGEVRAAGKREKEMKQSLLTFLPKYDNKHFIQYNFPWQKKKKKKQSSF